MNLSHCLPRRVARRGAALALVAATTGLVAACGSSGGGTSYWQANFTGGTHLYMSVVSNSAGVSGWAKYTDGSFQHYDGTKNSDGTYSVTAYAGDTLTINGSQMTAVEQDGDGTVHWEKISESAYKSAGGPGGS